MRSIVFYVGYQKKPLKRDDLYTRGLGGSETAVCEIAELLAKTGKFQVYITGEVETFYVDETKVNYIHINDFKSQFNDCYFDVVVAINYIHYLKELECINYHQSVFWLHNTEHFPWHQGQTFTNNGDHFYEDPRMSLVVCVSEWQKDIIVEKYPACEHKVRVIDNGVNRQMFSESMKLIPEDRVFIYSSGPDRGLEKLFQMWPTIVAKYEDAILRVFCPDYCLDQLEELCEQYDAYEMQGVDIRGSVSKGQLYKEIELARYWLYPSEYPETFCITALEMLLGKTIPLSTNTGNLKHLLKDFASFDLDKHTLKDDWDEIIMDTIDCIERDIVKRPEDVGEMLCNLQAYAARYQWKNVVLDWIDLLEPLTPSKLATHAFVISLKPDNEVNRKTWTERLHKAGFDDFKLIVHPATDGRDVDQQFLDDNEMSIYKNWKLEGSDNGWWNRDIKPGELGCAISHYNVWKYAHECNMNSIVVLEDDFDCDQPIVQEALDMVPCDWDMLYLGRNALTQEDEKQGLIVRPGPSYNMHAYALSRKGIEKIMQQNFQKILMPVDEFIQGTYTQHLREDLSFIYRDMNTYAVRDQVIKQTSNDKTSQTENIDSKPTYKFDCDANTDFHMNPEEQHITIFDYHNCPDRWTKKYLSPGVTDMDIELMTDEPISNVFSFKLFTRDFCTELREEAEKVGRWTTDRHYFYPTTDMVLTELGFNDIYDHILRTYVEPIIRHVYQLDGDNWENMNNENFLARYTPDDQPQLKIHHDHSDISALINLSEVDEEYTGGGTYFPKYKALHRPPIGTMSIHPGCITHKHGARPVLSGTRYIVVSFMKRR